MHFYLSFRFQLQNRLLSSAGVYYFYPEIQLYPYFFLKQLTLDLMKKYLLNLGPSETHIKDRGVKTLREQRRE